MLTCPICNTLIPDLIALNSHIDTAHDNLADQVLDNISYWFKKTTQKAQETVKEIVEPEPLPISTEHWIKTRQCGVDACKIAPSINCFKCGRHFCAAHCNDAFMMKLSPFATPDPDTGVWARVCEPCYVGRDGYADANGVKRRKTALFLKLRTEALVQFKLESNLILHRLEKLSVTRVERSLLSRLSLVDIKSEYWEPDEGVSNCPFCEQSFTLTNRRHHCRLELLLISQDYAVRSCVEAVWVKLQS